MTRRVLAAAAGKPEIRTWALIVVLATSLVGGCATSSPQSPGPSASQAAAASADGSGKPKATFWPGNAVLGIEALGVADGQIAAALADLDKGISTEDLALMRKAADFLAGIDSLLTNVDRLDGYAPMASFAERYTAAIHAITAAAGALRTAIDAGDAAGITSSTQALITALGLYTAVQPELATWVNDSFRQRRLLTR
jgi:hypothetical protein